MLTIVTTLKTGGAYTSSDVEALREEVSNSLSISYRFICITDDNEVDDAIAISLIDHHWIGKWALIEAFNQPGPAIFIELGTAVPGSLDALARDVQKFESGQIWLEPPQIVNGDFSTAIMAWSGSWMWMWSEFTDEDLAYINPCRYIHQQLLDLDLIPIPLALEVPVILKPEDGRTRTIIPSPFLDKD